MENTENIDYIKLKWKRPEAVEYPKTWRTFMARDIDSDELVEYRIQDLPEARIHDAYGHMFANYIKDEPLGQILRGFDDPAHFKDYKLAWNSMVLQHTPLVCFKSGSDEIIGLNMTYVLSKGDNFMEELRARFGSQVTRDLFDLAFLLFENFDTFEHYGVDEYLTSFGLSVDKNYRGRSIGDQFLISRKEMCREFGLKFTQTIFTSDFSNHNADKAGFQLNVAMKYDDVIEKNPYFKKISGVKSKQMTVKTLFT